MDKLKVIFKKLKRHHFWIVCGLVTVVAIVMVFKAVGTLDEYVNSQKQSVEGSFSTASNLARVQNHPNEEYHIEQEALNDKASEAIAYAWSSRYERQADLLVWPTELDSRLVQKVEPLRPIESQQIDDSDRKMPSQQDRRGYKDFIVDQLPKLAEVIGARWSPESSDRSGMGMGMEAAEDSGPEPLVIWDQANQMELQRRHFDWDKLPDGVPTTLHVLYAQEDLWVLEAIMEIIAETNGEETAAHKANIRRIQEISIGRAAGEPSGVIYEPASTGPPGQGPPGQGPPGQGPPDQGGAPVMPFGGGTPGVPGEGGSGAAGGFATGEHPAEGRYVDKDYQPLAAQTLQTAVNSEDPATAYLAVAKRMPVRMRLTMDQRRIPRLLLACANSDLTVEVRQVHVGMQTYEGDPSGGSGGGGGGGGSPFGGAVPGMGPGVPGIPGVPGVPGRGGAGAPPRPAGGGSSAGNDSQRIYDADVELYGIIYIYNPVNETKLGFSPEELEAIDFTGDEEAVEAP